MRIVIYGLLCSLVASTGLAQESQGPLNRAERAAALSRVRAMAGCVETQHRRLREVLRLIGQSETQRDRASDAAAREAAQHALDALILRASDIQRDARACVGGADLPAPGTEVIVRGPPPDPTADSVARRGGTVRVVETDAELANNIRIVRGEQVDGAGQVDAAAIRAGVRGARARIARCYAAHLDRGSIDARQLNLVFTVRGSGAVRAVRVEASTFRDRVFERCIATAGRSIRVRSAARGGSAIYSYTLRFGR